ncbi:GW dipeptide domain-containing protein [Melioribacter sp. OK-6-Me]|uniref:GW dipeptide domain-containing protein n=1 Tax=unclassified Melioribacter TaxID=2627329 RepID=UPI003ED91820
MKTYKLLIVLFLFIAFGCQKNDQSEQTTKKSNEFAHTVKVEDVIQVKNYTYLNVDEKGNKYWIAVPKAEFNKGEVIYFNNYMEMKNFKSTELNKVFDSLFFVDYVEKQLGTGTLTTPQKPKIDKLEIKVEPLPGGITIAELYAKSDAYKNKVVKIRGKVIKVNSGIMGKNWVHIQDGTSKDGNYDLTITTNENVNPGEVLTFEGKITLDKDFGYGYSYKVLMEEARTYKTL